jgi:deazaflavin-dependent oxidoreductase (nitroreductase family)
VAGTVERLERVKDTGTIRLTTFGRKTGKPHSVPVWFVADPPLLYLTTLKMKRDWPKNVRANGKVELDIAGEKFTGRATYVDDPVTFEQVKKLLANKYWAAWIGALFGLGPEGVFRVELAP